MRLAVCPLRLLRSRARRYGQQDGGSFMRCRAGRGRAPVVHGWTSTRPSRSCYGRRHDRHPTGEVAAMSRPVIGVDLPDVGECFGHRDGSTCRQCDGSHRHEWADCDPAGSYQVPRRCLVCGGRACDVECIERRHHRGPHIHAQTGAVRMVGK